jgi:hypothetical protein
MADLSPTRFRALVTIYRIKYPEKTARLAALRSDVLAAFEAVEKSGGRTVTAAGADGVNSSWQAGMSQDERLAALTDCLDYYEGRRANRGIIQL